jgi:hypothetical protein
MNSNDFDRMTTGLANTTSRRRALKLMAGGILGGAAMTAGIKDVMGHGHKGGAAGTWTLDQLTVPEGGAYSGLVSLIPRHFSKIGDELILTGDVLQGDVPVDTFSAPVILESMTVASTHNEMASVVNGRASDVSLAQAGGGACDILTLEIAPIYLDLLGLEVVLPNPLVLEINAVPGAGNLLGNLLCAVAGLLDGNSPLGGLAGLLNNILRALGLA